MYMSTETTNQKPFTKVLLNTDPNVQQLLDQVKEILAKKALYEKKGQFEDNKTNLGGVAFWFAPNEEGHYFLIYTSPPSEWDMDKFKTDLYELEQKLYNIVY